MSGNHIIALNEGRDGRDLIWDVLTKPERKVKDHTTHQLAIQGDQLYLAVCFWCLVKNYLSSVG